MKDLNRHQKAHARLSVECPHCHKTLSRSDNLARHMKTQHPNVSIAEEIEGLNEDLGEGLMSPEVLSADHDEKASKSRRSKKPGMETPDDAFAGEAMDDGNNIDPLLRAAQHPANALAACSVTSAQVRKDTPSSSDVHASARSRERNRKHLRSQGSESRSSDSEQSQSTESTRSRRARKIRCATLTAPSSVGSEPSERKRFDKGSDTSLAGAQSPGLRWQLP